MKLILPSALVVASPTAAPAKFALQVTANGTTVYLGKALERDAKNAFGMPTKDAAGKVVRVKSIDGSPVTDKAKAAECAITGDQLTCDGQLIGINSRGGQFSSIDMAPIMTANVAVTPAPITKGFSVDASGKLHFKNDAEFSRLSPDGWKGIKAKQGGEAEFGLFAEPRLGIKETMIYFQLGCPDGTHGKNFLGNGNHAMVYSGTAQAIPL